MAEAHQGHPDPDVAKSRARQISQVIGNALNHERARAGGLLQLEDAIAAAVGSRLIERRRLRNLIEQADLGSSWLSCTEIAALDLFWRKDGGFLSKLGWRTLAQAVSDTGPVHVFVPQRHFPDDPDRMGFVAVADFQAGARIREALLGLNPNLAFQVVDVPGERQDFAEHFGGPPSWEDFVDKALPDHQSRSRRTLISIGSPRSNGGLCPLLLNSLFGDDTPFHLPRSGERRCVTVQEGDTKSELEDVGVICYRRARQGKQIDILVGGDSALATLAAAREFPGLTDPFSDDGVAWYLVEAKVDPEHKRLVDSAVMDGYPKVKQEGRSPEPVNENETVEVHV